MDNGHKVGKTARGVQGLGGAGNLAKSSSLPDRKLVVFVLESCCHTLVGFRFRLNAGLAQECLRDMVLVLDDHHRVWR